MRLHWPTLIHAAVLASLVGLQSALAQNAWYEAFEGPQPTWRLFGANVRHQIEMHQRVQGEARTGQGCERLRISGVGEGYVHFAHQVGHPRVIDELLPTVWVKADRPAVQLLVRVVLPRTKDPRSGRPLALVLAGSGYTILGSWQQLRVDNIPQLLVRQARFLQAQAGNGADVREAYVDGVLLNVYGGPGVTNVWIDDLDIAGYVQSPGDVAGPSSSADSTGGPGVIGYGGSAEPAVAEPPPAREATAPGRVRLEGSVLSVDDRPLFPRAVQYRGEPLSLLRQLGFNAVWLAEQPTTEILEEASRQGLWVVCPPPLGPEPGGQRANAAIGPGFDRVLAWDLGSGLAADQLDAARGWADQVRSADRGRSRPLICRPESDLWAYSHFASLLLIGRCPVGTSLEMADYGTWVRERPRLARPGTPIWTTVQTQPAPSLREQWTALGRGEPAPTALAHEQLRLLVYTAISAGSRGLVFESESRLDANDPDSRWRAATLELLNLELDLMEPWAAAGQLVAAVPGSEPEVVAAVLRTDRARLLVPIWSAPGAQLVSGQAAGHSVSFVVPGVPESNDAYEIVPGGLKPLRRKRVTGGTRVTLDEFGLTSLVLLTQDPLVISGLTRRAQEVGRRAAQLQHQLAVEKLGQVERVHARLSARLPVPQAASWIAGARKSLESCDRLLAGRDYAGAYLHAHRAMRPLRLLERAHWQAAVGPLPSPVSSPAAVCFRTLPWHLEMMGFVAGARPGPNGLPGGDFEDLGALLQSGWRHMQRGVPGVQSECALLPGAARSGRFGLRLAARPTDPKNAAILVESPPVWMSSPEVAVKPGSLVRIQGWAQVPFPLTGSVDGLLIVDSIAGEPLAERIDASAGWVQFTLYRVATGSGRVSVTFALSGLGEAWLDDIRVESLDPGVPNGVTRLHGATSPRP